MTQELGRAFGVAILVAVFTARGGYASPTPSATDSPPAIGTCAGLALTAIVGAVLPRRATPRTAAVQR